MTILSLGAYSEQLQAIRTMASTFTQETNDGKWVVPHATQSRVQIPQNQAVPALNIKSIGKEDGPVSTMEILTQISHDNVGGQGYSGSTLWSDGQTSHVVTMDVINLLDILDAIFKIIKKLPGLKDVQKEQILIHVNDFNSTSPYTRADPRFTPNFGSQCMFICPNGRVVCVTLDRVAVTSTNSNKYTWRCLSLKKGHELALMKAIPTGFDYEPADGYIDVIGVRMAYFIREFSEINLTKPVPNSYAWAKIDTKLLAGKDCHAHMLGAGQTMPVFTQPTPLTVESDAGE